MKANKFTIIFILFFITSGYSKVSLLTFDQNLSFSLQGDNSKPILDYTMEGISLISPFIEFGWSGNQWLNGNNLYDLNSAKLTTTTLIIDQVVVGVLKYTLRRERPPRDRYQPHLWNTRITPSFPSGHTSGATAFSTIVASRYPELALPMVVYTLLSGYSQVYVGNHYVSDIIGGIVLGMITGKLILSVEKQITGIVTASSDRKADNLARGKPPINFSISIPFSMYGQ